MYRSGKEYDRIDSIVISLYIDYDIRVFPIDVYELCGKLGVELIPYSSYEQSSRWLLLKRSYHGFFVKGTSTMPPKIYYNDRETSEVAIRFTIIHELTHGIIGTIFPDTKKQPSKRRR